MRFTGTARDALVAAAAGRLDRAGVRTAAADAEVLAARAMHLRDLNALDDDAVAQAFEAMVEARARRIPLAHLLGEVRFRGIVLEAGPGVFTPQPETSSVVQWVVDALRDIVRPVVADLCTGSGTIALSVAHEVPSAVVHGVELDPEAFAWARRNADLRVAAGDPRVALHLDSAESCLRELDGTLDLVVSNPPYVAVSEAHIPSREVIDHDPGAALWAGADGLDVIRLVERSAARLVRPLGLVVIEHSDRQGTAAPALLAATGAWVEIVDHQDDEGNARFVTARRRS